MNCSRSRVGGSRVTVPCGVLTTGWGGAWFMGLFIMQRPASARTGDSSDGSPGKPPWRPAPDARTKVIEAAANEQMRFSHGVAAKLINCYLKVRFVCANWQDHRNVRSLHPPIDDLLLQSLAKENVGGLKKEWARLRNARWSKFSSHTYQEVVDRIREVLPADEPLWQIERFWIGFR